MRDQLKVIIGFGSIWGVFALGGILLSSFTWGGNDTAPEITVLLVYAFTTLPACILAIWYRKGCGFWLIALSILTLLGLVYQSVVDAGRNTGHRMSFGDAFWLIIFTAIPALLGFSLLRTSPLKEREAELG